MLKQRGGERGKAGPEFKPERKIPGEREMGGHDSSLQTENSAADKSSDY